MDLAKPKNIRKVSATVALLLSLPLKWGIFTGFYMWLSPFVMLNALFLLKSMVLLNVFGWAVLIISFFRNRWFCRYMCPVGLGCDTFSKWGKGKVSFVKNMPRFGPGVALLSLGAALTGIPLFILLDPMSVFNGFFVAFSPNIPVPVVVSLLGLPVLFAVHLFLPGIWCGKFCPLGGLFDVLTMFRKWLSGIFPRSKYRRGGLKIERRFFIASGIGLLAGLFIPRLLKNKTPRFFRPPASLPGDLFDTLCVRCGNCIKACPSNIIAHHKGTENKSAWMVPEISFEKKGYCLADCNLCGTVCPTGSISPFTIAAKKGLHIGSIEIALENCLLTKMKECGLCKSVCPYDAIHIVHAGSPMATKPLADLTKCVGCGACAAVCPEGAIDMVLYKQ